MAYIKTVSDFLWYLSVKNKMQKRVDSANFTLGYFESVRNTNLMRQQIGRRDLSCHKLPSLRGIGKGKITMGCSEDCMNTIIKTAKSELVKLERWRRFKHLSKNPITGKVIFT